MRPTESKKSDPTNKANRIEFSTFDPTERTRLVTFCDSIASSNKKIKEPMKRSRQHYCVRNFIDASYSQIREYSDRSLTVL